jgi:MurNAc alpha-1-phosphate uridylyltransferase
MKAIVLAAARGERMRPLTDEVPKPLLRAGGLSLIEWQVLRLVDSGITDIVVNVSHLGEQIVSALDDGARLGARIEYSCEAVALETAGGIALALPLLGVEPFVAVNADIYCDFDFRSLAPAIATMQDDACERLAHLVLVDNPSHHRDGDFVLGAQGRLGGGAAGRLTFSGIGVYRPEFFAGVVAGERKALGPMLYAAIEHGRVSGEHYRGVWMDIGTPQRLRELQVLLADPPGRPR